MENLTNYSKEILGACLISGGLVIGFIIGKSISNKKEREKGFKIAMTELNSAGFLNNEALRKAGYNF